MVGKKPINIPESKRCAGYSDNCSINCPTANNLMNLLEQQLEHIRVYDIDRALNLAEEANEGAQALGICEILKCPGYEDKREELGRLYQKVSQEITSKRETVGDKLKAIREGIKVLGLVN